MDIRKELRIKEDTTPDDVENSLLMDSLETE